MALRAVWMALRGGFSSIVSAVGSGVSPLVVFIVVCAPFSRVGG